jgi:hypothetical protein
MVWSGGHGVTTPRSHVHLSRRRVPERCRTSPNASYDGTFGIHLCNVREGQCFFRGPTFVLDANGRRFECRKVEAGDAAEGDS